jgi:mannose-6-phosphate isomerase
MTYEKIYHHKWGTALIIENNEIYCCKLLRFLQKHRTSLQYHKNKDETLYVQSGQFIFEYKIGEKEFSESVHPGEKIRFKPGTIHRVSALTEGEILEVSTHHEDSDTYQLETGGKIPK